MSVLSLLHDVLTTPVRLLVDPSKRVFAPFLLVAVLLSFAVLAMRGVGAAHAARALSSRRLWLHRSSLADAQLIFAKVLLRALFAGSWGVSTLAVTALIAGWLTPTCSAARDTLRSAIRASKCNSRFRSGCRHDRLESGWSASEVYNSILHYGQSKRVAPTRMRRSLQAAEQHGTTCHPESSGV